MKTLVLVRKKIESEDKTKSDTLYSHSTMETITNESDIDDVSESIYTTNISNIQKSLGWIADSVIEHNVSISKYSPLAGSSYIKLPQQSDDTSNRLINNQNVDDNECFKWSLVRDLNSEDHHQARITKADKDFGKKLAFKGIKFPVQIRDIHKIEKKNSNGISVFVYENKEKHSIYVSKKCEEK